jgi:hypothetical protein
MHAGAQAQQEDLSDEAALAQLRVFTKERNIKLTPEQEQAWLQQRKALRTRVLNNLVPLSLMGAVPSAAVDAQAAVSTPVHSESENGLAAQIAALPPRPGKLVVIDRSDGFDVNGRGVVDPEGRISDFAVDQVTGLMTYLAEGANGTYLIKTGRAGADTPALTIATARFTNKAWEVVTVTGKRIVGDRLSLLQGAGFLLARDTSAFMYRPGQGTENIAVPQGYLVAAFQRGDVLGTRHLLLERALDTDDKLGINAFRALGASFGIGKREDYALLNLKSGQTVPINISEIGKRVHTMSDCRAKNRFVNVCNQMQSRESLYDSTGKNMHHYYWRVNWFATPAGPVLIALENGLRELIVQDLNDGKKVVALSRPLGIANFTALQGDDGRVGLAAQLGFSVERIDDVSALLSSSGGKEVAAANTTPAAPSPLP